MISVTKVLGLMDLKIMVFQICNDFTRRDRKVSLDFKLYLPSGYFGLLMTRDWRRKKERKDRKQLAQIHRSSISIMSGEGRMCFELRPPTKAFLLLMPFPVGSL